MLLPFNFISYTLDFHRAALDEWCIYSAKKLSQNKLDIQAYLWNIFSFLLPNPLSKNFFLFSVIIFESLTQNTAGYVYVYRCVLRFQKNYFFQFSKWCRENQVICLQMKDHQPAVKHDLRPARLASLYQCSDQLAR